MKFLKKINKGLILTILVLLILFLYLFNLEAKRNEMKPQIEEAINTYLDLIDKYAVLPTDLQNALNNAENLETNEEASKKVEEYLGKFEEELKGIMIDNQTAIDIQKNTLEDCISENYKYTFTKYETKIDKIDKYVFDDDQVTVSFEVEIEVEYKYISEGEEKTRKDSYTLEYMTITFNLVNDEWKLVYSNVEYYDVIYSGYAYITY